MNRLPPFGSDVRLRLASTGWESDPRAAEPLAIVWSGPDPDGAIHRLLDYVEALPDDIDLLADEVATRRVAHLAGLSKELMRQLVRHPQWLFGADEDLLSLARSTLIQVAGDDGAGVIDVTEGTRLLSEMADRVVERALAEESPVGGPPLAVIAMGKWGGTELNYWSDIDLLFAFEGGSAEAALATRTAASLLRKLSNGPDGAVLRADPDLRPEGSRGPLARSIEAYRSYYERWAEPWEFQALLKARWAAGDRGVGEHFQELVEEVLWPETLNPDTVRSIRILKARVEAGADPGDIKRSPGGIRDIEFAVQMLQLVHGRFDEDLRQTGTLGLLEALADGGYVDPDDAVVLAESYRWLRALEHRLQLWELRPTQILPTDAEERDRLARAMGYRDTAGSTARESFEQDLVTHRSRVRRIHEALYFRPLLEAFAATPTTGLSREGAELRLQALGFRDVARAVRTFESLTSGLSRRSRLMQQMLPLILDWLADAPDPDLGLDQLRLLAANMPDHAELITTLHDRPVVGQRLALLGSSRLLGRYLDRIPEFVPDLDDDRKLTDLRPKDELERRLRQRLAARPESEHLGTLRRFARRQFIRVAARDLLGMADVERTMADLTAAADAAVAAAVDLIGRDGFAVIAMGGWGGMEMSYASDLDLMYVHDGRLESSAATARATQLRRLLTDPAADGVAWELDADLRPEGRSGPLVRSLESFAAYYERWAETWEFQALIKARPGGGDPALGQRFMDLVSRVLWEREFTSATATEIRQMKARIEKQRIPIGEDPDFHLKLGPGGLVDVEFLVQLLQLEHGGRFPEVRRTSTLEGLDSLERLEIVTSEDAATLREAYVFCTHVRNRLYLQAGRRIDALPRDPADEWRLALSLGYERRGDLREEYRRVTRRARRVFEDLFYP